MHSDQSHGEAAREKLDEDDQDLLTFTEVSERLRLEVAAAEALVAELDATGDAAVTAARERLSALRAAVQRNARQPLNDEHFEKFFGYPPSRG
jgi:hypothetical protein